MATATSCRAIPPLRDERIFFIRHALRAGFTIEEIFNLTKIDRWFLVQIKEIVDFEEELAKTNN
jgi:carbamoyl-phosphate synthase large subunit